MDNKTLGKQMKTPKLTKLETISLAMLQLQYDVLANEIDEDVARIYTAADMIIRDTPLLAKHVQSLLAKSTDYYCHLSNIVNFGFRW